MVDDNDRLPLTRSLESEVLAAFAVPNRGDGLRPEALLSALEGLKETEPGLSAALANAGFMHPVGEAQAILDWVDAVFDQWATHYALAPELQSTLERARTLAAAFALRDERFFVPGGHALHRLLDVIHNGLVGWHTGLGPAAANALEGAREAIERARRNFPSEPQVDETLELLSQKIHGHDAQLRRLDSVLLDREAAAMGDELAHLTAAMNINQVLGAHQVPGSVARFLKSDWLESGKLIVSRHGVGSSEWKTFANTTQLLADAVQPVNSDDTQGQQRLQATMQQLPGTLSRQLLSLQPDTDAIAGAVGLIEYALLRNMRGEDLGLLLADPIEVQGLPPEGVPSTQELVDLGIEPGAWFALDTPEGEIRVRFVGAMAENLYLVFMDFLGARAVRKNVSEFRAMLSSGEARQLNIADSFCRSMVEATELRQRLRQMEADDLRAAEAEQAAQAQAEQDAMAATFSGQQIGSEQQFGGQQAAPVPPNTEPAPQNFEPPPEPPPEPSLADDHTALATTHRDDTDSVPSADRPYESNTVVKLQIPMGTWMGFHDRDPPLMARVAVRDLEKDSYIFTNREGIKLRELTVAQLIALIDRDMVDILERKTNFRETVNQMRQEQDRLSNL